MLQVSNVVKGLTLWVDLTLRPTASVFSNLGTRIIKQMLRPFWGRRWFDRFQLNLDPVNPFHVEKYPPGLKTV